MKLAPGLYEQLVTRELEPHLARFVRDVRALGDDDAPDVLARHLYEAARRALGAAGTVAEQVALANRVLAELARSHPEEVVDGDAATSSLLLSLVDDARLGAGTLERPGIPLRHSELIVNGPRDRRVGLEIVRELPSADRVDLLMSFVKWSGFVELRDALARLRGRQFRVLTTTYMGATDVEALDELVALGASVRVSYDERRTRLHAKAWLFHRDSGFGTAIVGSSNLSSSALRDGCEWNVRLSQRDNPGVVAKLRTTFDQYWDDASFEPYDRERFRASVGRRADPARDALAHVVRLRALPHQEAVLDALTAERAAGHHRNLVVAATGTGKTVIAALDYARLPDRPSLLFVAHRDRILEQSLATFRVAVRDGNFGEKLTGRDRPIAGTHVFASVQSLHARRLAALSPSAYDVVIVDEFHHAAADTYTALLEHLRPKLLLGLTATPERADGASVLGWFDGRIAAESRLWDALDQDLLVPFQYFGVHDGTDLSRLDFRGGRYAVASLERLYTADEHRAIEVLRALVARVRDPRRMRALGFCVSLAHAAYMQAFFAKHGLPSAVVDGRTAPADRDARVGALERGELCCLFTVDVFNEGVDIPAVDTVLFLRPTESATVFLQQLGRGLRLHPEKACLTVLDFVGTAHAKYRFDVKLRALLGGGTRREVNAAVEDGFPRLPSGCAIQLEPRAQEAVLANLRRSLSSWAALADDLDGDLSLAEFLRRGDHALEDVYRPGHTFNELRHRKGHVDRVPDGPIARALPRALHVDDADRLAALRRLVRERVPGDPGDVTHRMLFALLADERPVADVPALFDELWSDPLLLAEVRELFDVLDDRRRARTLPLEGVPLHVHARYTRAEISAALGLVTAAGKLLAIQAGVYRCVEHACDLLFVTLDKDEREFTPTTLYRDYPISPSTFHWQTQSATREDSDTGRRYRDPPPGWRILLFVRRAKRDDRGVTLPFLLLGPVSYVSHEGERPMSITWRLEHPAPGDWFQQAKIAAG
jgi:superfamily II DNA or RNA helicase/HKD family nuclease